MLNETESQDDTQQHDSEKDLIPPLWYERNLSKMSHNLISQPAKRFPSRLVQTCTTTKSKTHGELKLM